MIIISDEQKEKLKNAKSPEEISSILKEDEPELSLDELEAVSGGVTTRNWSKDGCAATVEEGSNCWGTDGGCTLINIKYTSVYESNRCSVNTTHPCVYELIDSYVKSGCTEEHYKCIWCGRINTVTTVRFS